VLLSTRYMNAASILTPTSTYSNLSHAKWIVGGLFALTLLTRRPLLAASESSPEVSNSGCMVSQPSI